MKQGIVKFSKEFVTPIGLKEWASCEMEYDMASEDPKDVLTTAKKTVIEWYEASNKGMIDNVLLPGPSTELPIINKAEERLGILIENASTMDDLLKYKNDLSTPYLSNLFAAKLTVLK